MVAICTGLIYEEKQKVNPDQQRIAELYNKKSFFNKERLNFYRDQKKEEIDRIFAEYSPKIKAYFQGGLCPV